MDREAVKGTNFVYCSLHFRHKFCLFWSALRCHIKWL